MVTQYRKNRYTIISQSTFDLRRTTEENYEIILTLEDLLEVIPKKERTCNNEHIVPHYAWLKTDQFNDRINPFLIIKKEAIKHICKTTDIVK